MGKVGQTLLAVLTLTLAWAGSPATAQHQHDATPPPTGRVTPANPYDRGLYLLHNFEYGSAAAAFREAQAADPANVMAYWGEAMTYNHPLWAEQDAVAARAVLQSLAPDPVSRKAKARSEREANWLDAVETLYGVGTKVERDAAYHATMQSLFEADPGDIDARTFFALATLGLASQGRDTALYMKAAALLEEAFPANQNHPGLLHYMIHSYDDPVHAPLGERAAARYARVAPDAGHAQHMISHIYLALGRWEEVERANVTAAKVVNEQRVANGQAPTSCGHYNEWLVYALDQQGKDSKSLIDSCQGEALAFLAKDSDRTVLGALRNPFNNWAGMAVRHGIDTGRWPRADAVPAGEKTLIGRFELAYGRLIAARNDADAAEIAFQSMRGYRTRIAAAMPAERPNDSESVAWFDRAVAQGEAVVALARGDHDRGLELLRATSRAEAALPVPFGPPVLAKPSSELLGEELLALGRKSEAASAYREALAAAPNRLRSIRGLEAATAP